MSQTSEKLSFIINFSSLRYRHLKQQWEMKAEEVDLLQTKLQQSSYHKQQEELDALKKIIGEIKTVCANLFQLITILAVFEALMLIIYLN